MTHYAWSAAEPYEPFMGRWSRRLAAEVVAWIDAPPQQRWLDVGCGTGAASQAVLTGTDPASLIGVDPSEAYVVAARARLDDPRVTVKVGDAMALPVPDSSVDQVISGLVLNFVPDMGAAVAEMRRVLVPGGQATAYVWDYADGMQMLRIFWDAAIAADPAAEELDEGPRFPVCRPGGLQAVFGTAGFDVVDARRVDVPMDFRDFDDYWTPFLGGQGPAPSYVATLSEASRDRLRARLRASLPTEEDGSIHLRSTALAVRALP
jgi:SAM-dependent methyltransferase